MRVPSCQGPRRRCSTSLSLSLSPPVHYRPFRPSLGPGVHLHSGSLCCHVCPSSFAHVAAQHGPLPQFHPSHPPACPSGSHTPHPARFPSQHLGRHCPPRHVPAFPSVHCPLPSDSPEPPSSPQTWSWHICVLPWPDVPSSGVPPLPPFPKPGLVGYPSGTRVPKLAWRSIITSLPVPLPSRRGSVPRLQSGL